MSENEEKYSAYMAYYNLATTIDALFAGFIFTAITLLLTQLPDPTHISMQVTFLFLTVVLNVNMYLLTWNLCAVENCIRLAPELLKAWWRWNKTRTALTLLSEIGLGLAVSLMFLIWGMIYLALASMLVLALFEIFAYVSITKPYLEELKKKPWVRK